jgi:hypothetical protein
MGLAMDRLYRDTASIGRHLPSQISFLSSVSLTVERPYRDPATIDANPYLNRLLFLCTSHPIRVVYLIVVVESARIH